MEQYNKLVAKVTAFNTFDELEACLLNGYVPTIYPKTKAQRELIEVLRAMGYRVWTGQNEKV